MIEIVSRTRCVSCDVCVKVCPMDVFDHGTDGIPVIARQSQCQTCFMCEAYCPADALFVAPLSGPAPPESGYRDESALAQAGALGAYRRAVGWGPSRTPGSTLDTNHLFTSRIGSTATGPPADADRPPADQAPKESAASTVTTDLAAQPPRGVFAVLCVATAAYSVLQSLVVPALGVFRRELHTTPSGAAWILTGFLLSASVCTPILGRFGDLYGKRGTLVGALLAISAGSVISALADDLGWMVAGRLVQGAGGAVFPLCFAIIRDHFPPARRPRAFVAISTVMSIGGAAGTVVAGPMLQHLSSHWLFWVPAAVSALAALATARVVPAAAAVRSSARIGWTSAVLLASWLTLLLFAISLTPSHGWSSPTVAGLTAAAAALVALWLAAEHRARHPLVDLRTLALPTVRATNAATLLLGFGMFGSWMLVPLLVAQPTSTGIGFGASPTVVGLVMLPTAAGTLLVMPFNGWLSSRRGPRVTLLAGTATVALAFLALATAHRSLPAVCAAVLVMGGGVGLSFAAVASLVVEAVPLAQSAVSAGINTVMRTIGGSLGATVGASLLTASMSATGYPSDHAYTAALLSYAAAMIGACVLASRVPAHRT